MYILVLPVEVGYYDKLETIVGVLYGKHKFRYNGKLPIRPRPATCENLESNRSPFVRVMTGRVPRSTDVQTLAPSAHPVVSFLTHSMYRWENLLNQGA